jgi:hypothetical protein
LTNEKVLSEQKGPFGVREGGRCEQTGLFEPYFGGAGVNTSRLRAGSGFGLGFGAFFTSFLPLSLFPMGLSLP